MQVSILNHWLLERLAQTPNFALFLVYRKFLRAYYWLILLLYCLVFLVTWSSFLFGKDTYSSQGTVQYALVPCAVFTRDNEENSNFIRQISQPSVKMMTMEREEPNSEIYRYSKNKKAAVRVLPVVSED